MSKLNRSEFKELLLEWKQNFINEKARAEFKLAYPCYLVQTLNYGDLNYSNKLVQTKSLGKLKLTYANSNIFKDVLRDNLIDAGIVFVEDKNDIPELILKVDVKNKSLEEKKQLTSKIVDIIYKSSTSDLLYKENVNDNIISKHPVLNKKQYESYLNISQSDIEKNFNHIEKTNSHEAPIFISHLDHDNNIYYSVHDIIGHGSVERAKYDKNNSSKESIEFARKLLSVEDNPRYNFAIRNQLQSLTPGVGHDDIAASLVSYFATIDPKLADITINNFFFGQRLDDRKLEIVEVLKDLYQEYKKDVKRAETSIPDSAIGRYANYINICFTYLDF